MLYFTKKGIKIKFLIFYAITSTYLIENSYKLIKQFTYQHQLFTYSQWLLTKCLTAEIEISLHYKKSVYITTDLDACCAILMCSCFTAPKHTS